MSDLPPPPGSQPPSPGEPPPPAPSPYSYPPAPPLAAQQVEWRRLDRRMLLVHPVVELFKFLPVLVGIFVLGGNGDQNWWQLIGVAIPVTLGVVRYFTTRFRITPTQVELSRGIVGTKILTARLDRVRAVEVTATPIHRLLGLAKVEIGTASGAKQDDDKFALDGLPLAEARQLRAALLHRADPSTAAVPATADSPYAAPPSDEDLVLLTFDPRWVRFAPLTASGTVIAAGVLAVLGQFSESVDFADLGGDTAPSWVTDTPPVILVLVPILVFLALGAVFSVLGYLVVNWGFTLSRDTRGRSFHVRRGLLTTNETSLERERVRGLEIHEPLGLRLVGAGRLAAIVTGLGSDDSGSTPLVPPAPREVIDSTGADVIEQWEPLRLPLVRHGRIALRRRLTRAMVPALVFPIGVAALCLTTSASWWWLLLGLVPLPLAAVVGLDRYRRLGHGLTADHLVVRSGSLAGRQAILQRTGIIGWNVQQSWFQRRNGLATLVATTAAGRQGYAAVDIPEPLAIALADEAVPGLVTPFLA